MVALKNGSTHFLFLEPFLKEKKMKPVVHKAHTCDIPTLNKISVASKSYWGYPPEWIKKWLPDLHLSEPDFSTQSIYKLDLGGSIIGFCAIQENKSKYEIMHLWVLPDYIGKGYGALLLNESLKKTMMQIKDIIVEADPNAEAFYARQGFSTFDKVASYPKGRFLPLMKKSIEKGPSQ
jgi:GNAT superfamily N-acetyltransferase